VNNMKSILVLAMLAWTALSQARDIDTIVIHTTASNHTVEQIDAYHKSLGWDGCGYHFVVEKNGDVIQCRDLTQIGAHVLGANDSSVGIAWIGTDQPTKEQYESLLVITAAVMMETGTMLQRVKGHKDFSSAKVQGKTCPLIDMDRFRFDLAQLLNIGV
jgi:N-acetylmuramoyl-L-alanine amidase